MQIWEQGDNFQLHVHLSCIIWIKLNLKCNWFGKVCYQISLVANSCLLCKWCVTYTLLYEVVFLHQDSIMCIFLVDVEIPYPTENGDLIDDLIRSINETAVVSQTPQYVQHQYRLNDGVHDIQENGYMAADTYLASNGISNGTSSQNGSVYVHSYDQSYGIGNPNFVGDPYPMPTINLHDFEIEYIQYPVEVVKNQVSPLYYSHVYYFFALSTVSLLFDHSFSSHFFIIADNDSSQSWNVQFLTPFIVTI